MQGQSQKYGQKHETKELVQFHNHFHALSMVETISTDNVTPLIFYFFIFLRTGLNSHICLISQHEYNFWQAKLKK